MRRWSVGVAASLALLAGCADPGLERLERELAALRAEPGEAPAQMLPEVPRYPVIAYREAERRSPFEAPRSRGEAPTAGTPVPDLQRPREPLEQYPLESLALVGTLTVGGQRSALVRAPDGQVHRVGVGAHLGSHHGRITAVEPAAVQLVELVRSGVGWEERQRRLTLDGNP